MIEEILHTNMRKMENNMDLSRCLNHRARGRHHGEGVFDGWLAVVRTKLMVANVTPHTEEYHGAHGISSPTGVNGSA